MIDEITGIEKQRKNISKAKSTPKPKQKNKNIWWLLFQDIPAYLKKALGRAMREYEVGIKREKSALDNFAEKYVKKTRNYSNWLLWGKSSTIIRNIKVKIIMVCLIEQQTIGGTITIIKQGKAYFQSQT